MEQMKYIVPHLLKSGDRIAIVSPASPPDCSDIFRSMRVINDCGFEPVLGDNIRFMRSRGLCSAPIKNRVNELIWALRDDSISGIIASTGGFGTAQLLPYLPWDMWHDNRKPFIGFSDATALNNSLLRKSGLVSFLGPDATVRAGTGGECDASSLVHALGLLTLPFPWEGRPFIHNPSMVRCVRPGFASGHSVGGNLTTFAGLIGTDFIPNLDGAILFLEDTRIGGYNLALMLTHLLLAHVFERAVGVVFGEFSEEPKMVDSGDPSINDVIVEFFHDRNIPVVTGFNFSHSDISAVVPIGASTYLDADNGSVMFT